MTYQPTSITRDEAGSIRIVWDDGYESQWTTIQLRKACPCATCREKHRADAAKDEAGPASKPMGLPIISAAEARPLKIESMRPVGNYAYNIAFSDGHNSGLFTFKMLREGYK
jgi:DUF971 family protein